MTTERRGRFKTGSPFSQAKESRRKVVGKVTETILAVADAIEAQQREEAERGFTFRSFFREGDADPGFIRGLVNTPIYLRLSSEYVAGDSGEHLLCRVADILRDLAPKAFGRPGG